MRSRLTCGAQGGVYPQQSAAYPSPRQPVVRDVYTPQVWRQIGAELVLLLFFVCSCTHSPPPPTPTKLLTLSGVDGPDRWVVRRDSSRQDGALRWTGPQAGPTTSTPRCVPRACGGTSPPLRAGLSSMGGGAWAGSFRSLVLCSSVLRGQQIGVRGSCGGVAYFQT